MANDREKPNGKLNEPAQKFLEELVKEIQAGNAKPIATRVYQKLYPKAKYKSAASAAYAFMCQIRSSEQAIFQLEEAQGITSQHRKAMLGELLAAKDTKELRSSDGTLLGYSEQANHQVRAYAHRLAADIAGELPKQGRRALEGQETRPMTFHEAFAADKKLIEEEEKKQLTAGQEEKDDTVDYSGNDS